jgi:hypothetical protein
MIKKISSLLFFISIVLIAGCLRQEMIKPSQNEIDAYVKENPDLPELDKACIYDGRFEVGMRKNTVKFLLGEPKEVEVIEQPWAEQEKWTYKVGGQKIFYMEDDGVVGIEEL